MLQVLDVEWRTLLDMTALAAAKVEGSPLPLAWPASPHQSCADLFEIQTSVFGPLTTLAQKTTLNGYRCPKGDINELDSVPAITPIVLDTDSGAVGTERIANGDMAAVGAWRLGQGWSIAAGVATHATSAEGPLAQVLPVVDAGWNLFKLTVGGVTGSAKLRASLEVPGGKGMPILGSYGSPITANGTYGGVVKIPAALAAADNAVLAIYASEGLTVDNVSMQTVVPYSRTLVYRAEDFGTGFHFTWTPAGSMAGAFIRARVRRLALAA